MHVKRIPMPIPSGKVVVLAGTLEVAAVLIIAVHFLVSPVQEPGIIEGTVTIGTLSPVEPYHLSPEILAKAYEARKIIISGWDEPSGVKVLDLKVNGQFMASLPPGSNIVDITRIGIDRSPDVSKIVVLKAGEKVRLEIDIDTGIR